MLQVRVGWGCIYFVFWIVLFGKLIKKKLGPRYVSYNNIFNVIFKKNKLKNSPIQFPVILSQKGFKRIKLK